jgi:hypothetical protein
MRELLLFLIIFNSWILAWVFIDLLRRNGALDSLHARLEPLLGFFKKLTRRHHV